MHDAILPKDPMDELERNRKEAEQRLNEEEPFDTSRQNSRQAAQDKQQEVNQIAPTPLLPSPSHKKLIIGIVAVVVFVVVGTVGAYFFVIQKSDVRPVACTQEAKQCPDGSYVGRTGPNCEFAECPSTSEDGSIDIAGRKISADCPDNFTALQTGGPYYKAGSPNRQSLIEEGVVGEKITVTGFVFDRNCNPISNARLDFWQADGRGNYDNQGYRLRGYQYTDQSGRYVLETVMPAQYSSRPPHIHLKLQVKEDEPVLTSQLYFPGQSKNTADSIFNSSLVVSMSDDGKTATYNFKVDTE